MLSIIKRAETSRDRIAVSSSGREYTYQELLAASATIAANLLDGRADLAEARIAFLVPPSFDYVAVLWGIWRAGGIAVPLCEKHPLASITYVIDDTEAEAIVFTEEFRELLGPLLERPGIRALALDEVAQSTAPLPDTATAPDSYRGALILYTSGTTGNPKGVVTTHANIETQITALTTSWEWEQSDRILNILPLHHVHGIVNVTLCALWSGACCEFLPRFDPARIFEIFREGRVNVFMAVPTIYYKLIAYFDTLREDEQRAISDVLRGFRLMVSGSAALPVSTLERWREISGHTLLERYGMTEMGMAISNPYRGERRPGHIGQPLHGVTVRLENGEIQVKGDNIFREYWGKPEATADTFTPDGWFKTGDIAVLEDGYYRILGRNSVDIIKSGGYKISALEIEEVIRKHPAVSECAVVGIPDEEWGEIVGAALVTAGQAVDYAEMQEWLKDKLPGYKIPRRYTILEELPRNVMGKVTKKEVKTLFA